MIPFDFFYFNPFAENESGKDRESFSHKLHVADLVEQILEVKRRSKVQILNLVDLANEMYFYCAFRSYFHLRKFSARAYKCKKQF